jgi:ABC-type dipeptide/oligopeptide/nickel transport system ATPase component
LRCDGKVLLLGSRACPAVAAIQELAEELEIAVLPQLETPFGEAALRDSVATLLSIEEPPNPPILLDEAVRGGWLELWYQPKIDTHSLALNCAEALIRIRHPTWGIVPPAYFIPDDGDPHFSALSEFVISRAVDDWRYFVAQYHLTTFDNVALPLKVLGRKEETYHDEVTELLGWVGLGDRMWSLPPVLSGGEKQRAAIARAVIARPQILLADEPTGNVDPGLAQRLLRLFIELNKSGTSVVIATHDIALMDQYDARLVLHDGRIHVYD